MRISDLQKKLGDRNIFTSADLRKYDPNFHSTRLGEWQKRGMVRKIVKGVYLMADSSVDEGLMFELANNIYRPSYISLQSALAYYNLIPEGVYTVTSVCTRRTYHFDTVLGKFDFRNLKRNLFFGYETVKTNSGKFIIASPEKALLDLIYLSSDISILADIEGLRLNPEMLKNLVDTQRLIMYSEQMDNNRVKRVVNNILKMYFND